MEKISDKPDKLCVFDKSISIMVVVLKYGIMICSRHFALNKIEYQKFVGNSMKYTLFLLKFVWLKFLLNFDL